MSVIGSGDSRSRVEIDVILKQSIRFIRIGGFGKAWRLRRTVLNGIMSSMRRRRLRGNRHLAPVAIAVSPTMRCNLSCAGCYAADYPRDDEISLGTLERVFASAAELGVFTVVVTGGEPLLKDGLLDVLRRHRRLTFLMITNGLLVDDVVARTIGRSGNIVPTVSVEGDREETDMRRGAGVYDAALRAMDRFRRSGAVFGFSTTVTRRNHRQLVSEEFTDEMIRRGCTVGFHTEYVPVARGNDVSRVLTEEERSEFRRKLLMLRRTKPILLMHLPDDEYGTDGRCEGVAGGTVHINSQGFVEPCPFCHYAADNIRDKSLAEVINSDFLAGLRTSKAVYRRTCVGCALVENADLVKEISAMAGARRTDVPL